MQEGLDVVGIKKGWFNVALRDSIREGTDDVFARRFHIVQRTSPQSSLPETITPEMSHSSGSSRHAPAKQRLLYAERTAPAATLISRGIRSVARSLPARDPRHTRGVYSTDRISHVTSIFAHRRETERAFSLYTPRDTRDSVDYRLRLCDVFLSSRPSPRVISLVSLSHLSFFRHRVSVSMKHEETRVSEINPSSRRRNSRLFGLRIGRVGLIGNITRNIF